MRAAKISTMELVENQKCSLILDGKTAMSLQMKRGLLKRSRALTMDIGDRMVQYRTTLKSLPEYESGCALEDSANEEAFPSLPDRLLKAIGLFDNRMDRSGKAKHPGVLHWHGDPIFNKNLNEPDIEEKFARLSLAFKTDKFTLGKRLDLQLRQRDIAEKNIDSELRALRESLNALNQLCTESDMRELITKTQQHVDIVQQATMRMSSRAETYGAIQQEQRMNCAFETMLNYVEHLKLLYDKEHLELEEYRRLLAVHNLLPDDKSQEDDSKRILPPRSQSLSCSSRPEIFRRGSLGTFIRPPGDDKTIIRENSAGHINVSGWNLAAVRQKLESKTRLLSSVCLLNNNFDSSTSATKSVPSGSVSPKSRRSSLPVGPLAQSSSNTASSIRMHNSINEKHETKSERKESFMKASRESHLSRTESEESTFSRDESENPTCVQEQPEDARDENSLKDSSDVNFSKSSLMLHTDQENNSELHCSMQESTCGIETDGGICLLPDIIVPVKSKPVYLLNLIQKAAASRIWRLDSTTLLLHARYMLSAVLATAAMLTLVLTFVSN